LVVAKVRERLTVSKQPVKKMDMERFNLKKLNNTWDTIRENIKILAKESIGHCESKHHKPQFDEECSTKLQWSQDPCKVNKDNLSTVSEEASRHFRNKKREYLKDKINKLDTNSKNTSSRRKS
jgi:hypothetical protein